MKSLGGVPLLGNLYKIKPELGLYMGSVIIFISNNVAKLFLEPGELNGHGTVDRGMTIRIRHVVRQCTQGKSHLVHVLRLANHFAHKVTATHVMDKVAEKFAASGVITHVLNQTAAVSISVRGAKLFDGSARKTLAQYFLDV